MTFSAFVDVKLPSCSHFFNIALKVWKWTLEIHLKCVSWYIWRENWGKYSTSFVWLAISRTNTDFPSWTLLGWFEGQVEEHDAVHKVLDGIYCCFAFSRSRYVVLCSFICFLCCYYWTRVVLTTKFHSLCCFSNFYTFL